MRSVLLSLATLMLLLVPLTAAVGSAEARATDDSCPDGQVPEDGFADTEGRAHEDAIDCVVWWEVAQGTCFGTYQPAEGVRRDQMASFIARSILQSGGSLPTNPDDHFPNDDGPHHASINQLAEVGVVDGYTDGTYRPGVIVTRDQMATFLVRAYEHRTGETLTASEDFFTDDEGNPHEPRINRAAQAGFTAGTGDGYAPRNDVRRDQMASFLARMLDLIVEQTGTSTPTNDGSTTTEGCEDSLEIVSRNSDGQQADRDASAPSVSADGRYVAFVTGAGNLIGEPESTDRTHRVFVRDRGTGTTELVSVEPDGSPPYLPSRWPSISADGRYVAFQSQDQLVSSDTNSTEDIYVHDRTTDTTERISLTSRGEEADADSEMPVISGDGRWVAFVSHASLVPGDTGWADVYLHDRQTDTVVRVSEANDGTQANFSSYWPAISADGQFVAFHSTASNLAPDDDNDQTDVFLFDRTTGDIQLISRATDGSSGDFESYFASVSADGRWTVFFSRANDLVSDRDPSKAGIYLYDRVTDTIEQLDVPAEAEGGAEDNQHPVISGDGRFVAFVSSADGIVEGDTDGTEDVFVYDRETGKLWQPSQPGSDAPQEGATAGVSPPAISHHGRHVVFVSNHLVAEDNNGEHTRDVYLWDRGY